MSDDYLTPGAAAAALYVNPKTLLRWAQLGRIRYRRTSGGHHRYAAADIHRLAAQMGRKSVPCACGRVTTS